MITGKMDKIIVIVNYHEMINRKTVETITNTKALINISTLSDNPLYMTSMSDYIRLTKYGIN